MNLDPQDLELIKVTVKAAVGEATSELVTKTEFKEFRSEVLLAHQQFYPREVVDLQLRDRDEQIARLWEAVKDNKNVLSSLWDNAWGKVALVAGAVLQIWMVWQLLHP